MQTDRAGGRVRPVLAYAAEIAGLALLVVAVNEATVRSGLFPAFWPTSGVALVLLLVRGVSRWPALFLGIGLEFLAPPGQLVPAPMPFALAWAGGWTAAHALIAWALGRSAGGPGCLHSLRGVLLFLGLAGVVGPGLRLLAALAFGGPAVDRGIVFEASVADLAGTVVVVPPALWLLDPGRPRGTGTRVEALVCGASLVATATWVFRGTAGAAAGPPLYLISAPLAWATLRFGVGGAALGSLAVTAIALGAHAAAAPGPGAGTRLQTYLAVVAVSLLILGVVVQERTAAAGRVEEARRELDHLLQRRIQEEREERDFGRLVLETSRALVATLDPDGRLSSVNRAFAALAGGDPAGLEGRPLSALVPEDERPRFARLLAELSRAHAPVSFAQALVGADGARRELTWSGLRLEAGSGSRLLVAGLDVTGRERARREVERSLSLVEATLESTAEGVLAVQADGTEVIWNARFAELWEVPEGLPRRAPAVFAHVRERVADPAGWDESLRLGLTAERDDEAVIELRDGRIFERVSRPRWLGPRVAGRVWSFRDVTLRVRAEAERDRLLVATRSARLAAEEAAAAALRAVAVRDDFLSIASHELRTPLTSLKAHLQRIRRLAGVDAIEAEGLSPVLAPLRRQLRRLGLRLGELLDVATFEAEVLPLAPVPVDLRELAREVLDRQAEEAARQRTPLVFEAASPVPGRWDPARLSQAIGALLANAIKFGAGRPVTLEVGLEGDGWARLAVTDRGPGVAPADRERIFERFERSVDSRHFGGFGLGLWFARRIVEASGGRIELESEPGRGATFTLLLPRRPGLAAAGGEAR